MDGNEHEFGHELLSNSELGQGRGQIHHLLFGEEKVKIWMEFYNDNVLEGHKRSR